MAANNHFTVGVINPTRGQDSLGELETLMPKNISLIRDSLNIREQTEDEYSWASASPVRPGSPAHALD